MKNKKSRRISASSAYIGAGNKTSVFSRKARKPYENLSDIYKKEIKKASDLDYRTSFKKLTDVEKSVIKHKIRLQQKKSNLRFLFIAILSACITGVIIFVLVYWINTYF